jgi:hypothetical protein
METEAADVAHAKSGAEVPAFQTRGLWAMGFIIFQRLHLVTGAYISGFLGVQRLDLDGKRSGR